MNNVRFFNAVFFCDLMPVNAKSISDIPETVASFNLDFCAFCRNFFSSCKISKFFVHSRYPGIFINIHISIYSSSQPFKRYFICRRFCCSPVNCSSKLIRQLFSYTFVHRIIRIRQNALHFFASRFENLVCVILPSRINVTCRRTNFDCFLVPIHKALWHCLPCFSVLVNQASHLTNIRSHRLIQFI